MLYPEALNVLITNRCTAECAHCCMNSGPGRTEALDAETIISTIDTLHRKSPLRVVVFAGGEPTLAKNALRPSIKHCKNLGITTRMVTNASWAGSDVKAKQILLRIRKWGLDELNISADDHHLPYIPFGNVVRAWNAAKGLGFKAVIIANSAAPWSRITPEYIMKTLGETLPVRFDDDGRPTDFAERSADGTFYGLSNTRFQKLERAARLLPAASFQPPAEESDLAGGCPHAIANAALSPNGNLLSCCGFELDGNSVLDFGDCRTDDPIDMIEDANQDPIVKGIAYLGPLYLRDVVRQVAPEISMPTGHGSVCEVCRAVVKNAAAVQVLRENAELYAPAARAVERMRTQGAA